MMLDVGDLQDLQRHPDRTMTASVRRRHRIGTLDLYLGGAGQTWEASDVWTRGLGGSETMAVRMASRMADRGWRVRVYGAVPNAGTVAQVEYLPWWLYDPTEPRDALVCSRIPSVSAMRPNAGVRVLWLHDADYPDLTQHVSGWDQVWCVGAWQAHHLLGVDVTGPDGVRMGAGPTVHLVRNGIDAGLYPHGGREWGDREPWVVYSSSPDRGAHHLLGMWDDIYQRCWAQGVRPQLHLAYGFSPTYEAMQHTAPHLRKIRAAVEDGCRLTGVVWHGGMPQPQLADLQQRARVWAYPTSFPEVSCITAMEAQAAGLACIYSGAAELPRTMGDVGEMLPEWEGADSDREAFTAAIVACLTDPSAWGAAAPSAGMAGRWGLDPVALDWHVLLTG